MNARKSTTEGVLAEKHAGKREEIVDMLTKAYWMEIETVMNYLANASYLEGVRAEEVAESLSEDVNQELGHARLFADRIKELYGRPPGSSAFNPEQSFMQPPKDPSDVSSVIRGVIQAEADGISYYNRIIEKTDGLDWTTQDMVIEILRDEESHLRQFEGFLKEYE